MRPPKPEEVEEVMGGRVEVSDEDDPEEPEEPVVEEEDLAFCAVCEPLVDEPELLVADCVAEEPELLVADDAGEDCVNGGKLVFWAPAF